MHSSLAASTSAASWTGHDTRLVVAALIGIAVIVVLISWLKTHPFLALTIGSIVLGVIAGMPLTKMVTSYSNGIGSTTASVGVLIALGAMLGRLLADSGGADQIVDTIVGRAGHKALPWAMALVAALIGLPMFFEIGLVLLIPVIILVTRRSSSPILRIGIPAVAGLSVLHGLIPPHPGPLAAIAALKVNLGLTLGLGLIVAVPSLIIAGPLFGSWIAKRVDASPPDRLVPEHENAETAARPGFGLTLATVLLPVVLMLAKAVVDIIKLGGPAGQALDFVGNPLLALLIAVIVAMFTLGRPAGFTRGRLSETIADSLPPIAGIMLIVAAGGGFKQVLVDAGVGKVITQFATGTHFSALILAWLIAVAIRVATGSATVATISAAGIVSPLVAGLDPVHGALLALAVGSGSLFFSHVNDAGFWLVKEYFGMRVGQTIRSWSVMETILSVVSLLVILLLGAVL